MRFDVVTIFPAMFGHVFEHGVVGRGIERGVVQLHTHDLRDFTHDRHRQVDDMPFGGGPGMVIKPEPVFEAVESIRPHNPGPVVLMEPWGERLDQRLAAELAAEPGLIIVCGRYEGIDDRVRTGLATREISIGEYVLSGGEIPALAPPSGGRQIYHTYQGVERVMNVIQQLEKEQQKEKVPALRAGDTVKVHAKVVEGTRERIQVF